MKAARLHKLRREHPAGEPEGRGDRRAEDRGPARRHRPRRRRGALPHRHPRHRGPVEAHTGPRRYAASVHLRARELGLGRGGRPRRHERRGRRYRDLSPPDDLRPVPRLPGRRRHALRERRVPGHLARRRLRRPAEDQRTRGREAGPCPRAQGHSGAGGRRAHRLPRRQEVRPPSLRGNEGRRHGRRGLGHIGIQCLKALTPTEIIVTDPNEKALELAREWGADETVKVEEGYVDTVLEMTDGKGPRSSSTTSASEGPRTTPGR